MEVKGLITVIFIFITLDLPFSSGHHTILWLVTNNMINKTKKAWWSKKYEKNSYTFNQNYNKVYLKYVNGYHQLDLSANNPLTPRSNL